MKRHLLTFAVIASLGGCSSAQLATFNSDVSNFQTALNADVQAVATAGIPALCALATGLYVGYSASQAALTGQAAADLATATKVYTALTGPSGLCAPGAIPPANAAAAIGVIAAQVKAIQAALKPTV